MKRKLLASCIVSLGFGVMLGLVIGINVKWAPDTNAVQEKPQEQRTDLPTVGSLLELVNAERAKNGAPLLKEDARLSASAQMKANDEVTYGYFGHISPPGSPHAGKHGYEFIEFTGIRCITDSENLTNNINENTSQAAVNAWISSPPHHAAMIDPRYTLTGFGINGNQIVQHFCQPL